MFCPAGARAPSEPLLGAFYLAQVNAQLLVGRAAFSFGGDGLEPHEAPDVQWWIPTGRPSGYQLWERRRW